MPSVTTSATRIASQSPEISRAPGYRRSTRFTARMITIPVRKKVSRGKRIG